MTPHFPDQPSPVSPPRTPASLRENPSAWLLIFGFVATALMAFPGQSVMPFTIKSIVAALSAITALLLLGLRIRRGHTVQWSRYLIVPLGLLLMAMVSTFWAPPHATLVEAVRWFVIGSIIFAGINALHSDFFRPIAYLAHGTALALSLVALAQFWLGFDWFPAQAGPGSTFGNRNHFSEFIAVCMPFSFWMLLQTRTVRSALLHGSCFGFIVLALMSTGSRAPLIAAIVGLLAIFPLAAIATRAITPFTSAKNIAFYLSAALAVIVALGFIPSLNENILRENRGSNPIERAATRLGSLAADKTYEDGSSFGLRSASWKATLGMMASHPVRGVGAGAWNHDIPLYLPEAIGAEGTWHAHNEPLQLVAEYGLMGWLALAASLHLLIGAAWQAWRRLLRPQDAPDQAKALRELLLVLSLLMFGIVSLSGLPLHAAATCYALGLVLAMLLVERRGHWAPVRFSPPRLVKLVAPAAAALALLLACLVSVQAFRSDFYLQRGAGTLLALSQNSKLPKHVVDSHKSAALDDLRRSLDIYAEHDTYLETATIALGQLEDYPSVLWLNRVMLRYRPHAVTLRCDNASALAESQQLAEAQAEIAWLQEHKPQLKCLPFSSFVVASGAGDHAETVRLGNQLIAGPIQAMGKDTQKFIIDRTYLAATHQADLESAISVLKYQATHWPELRVDSLLKQAQLHAQQNPDRVVPSALQLFKDALASTPRSYHAMVFSRIPAIYQKSLQ
jgi:O-antigen ligase